MCPHFLGLSAEWGRNPLQTELRTDQSVHPLLYGLLFCSFWRNWRLPLWDSPRWGVRIVLQTGIPLLCFQFRGKVAWRSWRHRWRWWCWGPYWRWILLEVSSTWVPIYIFGCAFVRKTDTQVGSIFYFFICGLGWPSEVRIFLLFCTGIRQPQIFNHFARVEDVPVNFLKDWIVKRRHLGLSRIARAVSSAMWVWQGSPRQGRSSAVRANNWNSIDRLLFE